jgi:hypothetical protein
MRLLCPFCQKAIAVPDTEAGKAVDCPECGERFAAPQLYTPAPAPLAAPTPPAPEKPATPPAVPETYVHEGPTEPKPAELPEVPKPDRELSGFAHMASFPIDPRIVRWIPAGALFLALVLTIFPWDGLYPGGYGAYTQTGWGAAFAGMSKDDVADDELRLSDELDRRLKTNWWLIPYLLLLLPTLVLAVAGPVVDLARWKLPPQVESIWQFRPVLLAVLAIVTLLFLMAQWASGLGLQTAVNGMIEDQYKDARAAANTPEKVQRVDMRAAMKKGEYHVRTTPWLRLSVLLHLLAAAAVAGEAGLMLRGKKPPPRVGVMW